MASDWHNYGCSLSRIGSTVELVVNSIKTSSATAGEPIPVSYTHLTLPTILLV